MTARMVEAVSNPLVDCLGHPSGRLLLKREPYEFDVEAVIAAAAEHGTMIEINGSPRRRDLNEHHARMAAEAGVKPGKRAVSKEESDLAFAALGAALKQLAKKG